MKHNHRLRRQICCRHNFFHIATLLTATSLAFSLPVAVQAEDSYKVAFVADQGVDQNARAVLSLIANDGVDLLLVQGDLGYVDNSADRWELNIDNSLGDDFPVLAVIGNHDGEEWPRYEQLINERVRRAESLRCTGRPGVKSSCRFGDLHIVQVSPGIHESDQVSPDDNYDEYITESFRNSDARWKICSWHKNQRLMQTGNKFDETGWSVYEACLAAGAIVATGHEHSYSRTFLLDSFENQQVVHRDSHMEIGPGSSFAFVSGLGGWEARSQITGGDWWASIYTASQGAVAGALICDFGDSMASCKFKSIDGGIPDQFTLGRTGSEASTVVNVPDERPDPPSGLRLSRYSEHTAELFWDRANVDNNVVTYEIRLDDTVIEQIDALSTLIDTPLDQATHQLEIIAIDRQNRRSAPSAVTLLPPAGITTASSPVPAPLPPTVGDFPPTQPGGLRHAVYSEDTAEFHWQRSSDNQAVVAYEININGTTVQLDALSFLSRSISKGQRHTVSVRALDNEGNFSTAAQIEFIGGDGQTLNRNFSEAP